MLERGHVYSRLLVEPLGMCYTFFFFNDTATTEIYTLSLHDALPICRWRAGGGRWYPSPDPAPAAERASRRRPRSEEHTSELQSRLHLVCRLLLEKKNTTDISSTPSRSIRNF